jgi:hypothetical protein
VYVFAEGIEPNFTDTPVATGEVTQDATTQLWGYSIPLQAANYNAAFACSGTDFIPAAGKPAEILPAATTTVDFSADDAPPPVGSLSGEVASDLVGAESCADTFDPAVYVFEEGVTPNDTDSPVATGLVTQDGDIFGYLIEDIVADTYVAAYTCTGTDFVPVDGKEAVITIGGNTPVSFTTEDVPAP